MRCISPNPGYRFTAVHEETEVLASGLPKIVSPGLTCEFSRFDTTDWERELARKTFKFRGVPMAETGLLIDPVPSRVSSYDSDADPRLADDGYAKRLGFESAKALKEKVEQRLLVSQNPNDHIVVEPPADASAQEERENLVVA